MQLTDFARIASFTSNHGDIVGSSGGEDGVDDTKLVNVSKSKPHREYFS